MCTKENRRILTERSTSSRELVHNNSRRKSQVSAPTHNFIYRDAIHNLREHAHATDGVDLLLSFLGEEAGLDDARDLRHGALAQHLELARLGAVDHRHLVALVLRVELVGVLREQRPELLDVHLADLLDVAVLAPAVVAHTDLTKKTRVLAVLANATVAGRHMAALLPVVLQS